MVEELGEFRLTMLYNAEEVREVAVAIIDDLACRRLLREQQLRRSTEDFDIDLVRRNQRQQSLLQIALTTGPRERRVHEPRLTRNERRTQGENIHREVLAGIAS